MKRIMLLLILVVNILASEVNFTDIEKKYIKSNTVTIGMVQGYSPFSFKHDGNINGYSYDFIKLVTKKSGLKIKIQMDNWTNTLNKFKNKQIDIVDAISYKKSREVFTNFSQAYYEIPNVIFSRKGEFNNYTGFESLKGKKVGITKDIYYYDTLKNLGLFELVEFKSSKNKMKALAYKKVDAIFNNLISGQKYIKRGGYSNIEVLEELDTNIVKKEDLRLGIKKENKVLFSIINKSISAITLEEKNTITDKWFGVELKSKTKITNLTLDEKQYLNNKKQITMCIDPDWMPFEKFDKDGKHIGMSADYFKIFSDNLNLKIKVIPTKTWDESISLAKNRKCDILSLAMETPQRKEYLNFTTPYLKVPLVIATKLDVPFVNNLQFIKNEKVGITKGYAFIEILKSKYPKLNIVEVENIAQGLKKVNQGKLFGYIGTLASIGHIFQTRFSGELKIAGKFDESWELGIGVRNDDKILLYILQKAVNSLDSKQKQKILNDWVSIKYEKGIDYTLVWQILVVVFIIILFLVYRQIILKKQNQKLEDSINVFEALLDSSLEGILIFDTYGNCIEANNKLVEICHVNNKSDLIGKNITQFISKESLPIVKEKLHHDNPEPYEINVLRENGEEFPALLSGKTITLNNQKVRVSAVLDMTDIKHKENLLLIQSKMVSMGEMIGNIAHQWRQPLSVISTAATSIIMEQEYGILKEDELIKSCYAINENAQYLSKTISDFKNFIKGDRSKKIFSLKNDIDSFLHLVESSIKHHYINIILDLEEDIKINGYENELIQCLINIFNNAKDVLVEKDIKDKFIFISTCIKEDKAIIKIKDNAGGIPIDIISKVFEPYFTTKHKSKGTGLGLHITYNLVVDGMDGNIEATNKTYIYKNQEYTGAEFTILLPLN